MIDIDNLRALCKGNKITWTRHIQLRLLHRGITKQDVFLAIDNGCIIEQYPDDRPAQTCLISGRDTVGLPLHVCCGIMNDSVLMVTAYRPDKNMWSSDFKQRV